MKKLVLALILMSQSVLTLAAPSTTQQQQIHAIFQQLAQQPLVRANFSQQKKLASMNKTFTSTGQIVFAQQQGILWQVKTPVMADLIMTKTALVQKTANTQSKIRLEQNQYAAMAHIFMQLMAGNQQALQKYFSIQQLNYNHQQWQMRLVPKQAQLKKLFTQIDVSGGQYVQKMLIQEPNQGQTLIQFSQHSRPVQLSGQENALFQLAK